MVLASLSKNTDDYRNIQHKVKMKKCCYANFIAFLSLSKRTVWTFGKNSQYVYFWQDDICKRKIGMIASVARGQHNFHQRLYSHNGCPNWDLWRRPSTSKPVLYFSVCMMHLKWERYLCKASTVSVLLS